MEIYHIVYIFHSMESLKKLTILTMSVLLFKFPIIEQNIVKSQVGIYKFVKISYRAVKLAP